MKRSDTNHQRACIDLFSRMSEYLDDQLDAELRQKIERHLAQCRSCRNCLATLRRTVALCRAVGNRPVPEDVSRRLRKYFSSIGKD